MDDSTMSEKICIYYGSDGKEWADYLTDKLSCEEYNIETVLKNLENADSQTEAKVNVFLITPDVTQQDNWNLMNYFDSAISIAVLAGINNEDWSCAIEEYKTESLNEWCFFELYAEEEYVRELIVLIISLYENELHELDDTYENIPADTKREVNKERVPLPKKDSTSSVSERTFHEADTKKGENEAATEAAYNETKENDNIKEDDPYDNLSSCSRPVNTVRYVFRQGGYIYVLLEGVNDGFVQLKFHGDSSVVSPACVSDKTTVYSFQLKRTERETFDVTLDGKEIGYGVVEREAESKSEICEDVYAYPDTGRDSTSSGTYDFPHPERYSTTSGIYDFPHQGKDRASLISTSSGASSLSARSSNASSCDKPPPCSSKPALNKYANFSLSYSETSEIPEDKFTIPTSCLSDSYYETTKSWTGSGGQTPTASSSTATSFTKTSIAQSSKLDKIHRLLEEVTDPVDILCQSLHAENLKHLDEKMTSMLQATETLKSLSFKSSVDALPDPSDTVCPTLMHFGAKYNLKIFCQCLLNNPLTRDAAIKRNKDGCYPHDVARDEGHTELAAVLESGSRQLISSKARSQDSSVSQRASQSPPSHLPHSTYDSTSLYVDMSYMSPPPVYERSDSNKSQSSESGGSLRTRQKSILKKSSQNSLTEDDHDVPVGPRREGSVSSTGSGSQAGGFRVTLGPSIYIDDESTPVPRLYMEDPLNDMIADKEDSQDKSNIRQSDDIERSDPVPFTRPISEEDRTHRKDIESYFGFHGSASVPSEYYMRNVKKPGMIDKLKIWKKDKSRTKSDPRFSAGEIDMFHGKPRLGVKASVHRKDVLEGDPTSEQFRSRLQTYPGPGQILIRPNLKHLKKLAAEKELSSAIPDLAGPAFGGMDSLSPPVPWIQSPLAVRSAPNSPLQRSKEHHFGKRAQDPLHGSSDISTSRPTNNQKDKEVSKREKKKANKKANKKKIQLTITNAERRRSMRIRHALNAPVDSAPALPPRPANMKSIGGF